MQAFFHFNLEQFLQNMIIRYGNDANKAFHA